jgi:hypothetical protein
MHLADSKIYQGHDLTGLLSPKFYSKTGLTSGRLEQWISGHPGYDLYGINGQPYVSYTAFNTIEQAERSHGLPFEKGIRALCAEIGLDLPAEFGRQTNSNAFYCNYWCGTREFWQKWTRDVLIPIRTLRDSGSELARELFAPTSYASPTPVFLITFIYERLLGLYLASNKSIPFLGYPWKLEEILGLPYQPRLKDYLKEVGAWVDGLDRSGGWTSADRERLVSLYTSRLRPGHDGSDALNFDLPKSLAGGPAGFVESGDTTQRQDRRPRP